MKTKRKDQTIEHERGATYARPTYAVYEHFVYGRGSVLAGQSGRRYVDGGFATPEEAKAKYPDAEILEGSTYQAPCLSHLPGDDDVNPHGDPDWDDYRNE